MPAPDLAQAALEAVLTSWKSGLPADPEGRLPNLQVIDKHRKPGQMLDDFEILGETPGDAKRCFAVRLQLSEPQEEQRVRYVVIGIDPLLVFRHEDLQDLCQWDHPMPAADEETPAEQTELIASPGEEQPLETGRTPPVDEEEP